MTTHYCRSFLSIFIIVGCCFFDSGILLAFDEISYQNVSSPPTHGDKKNSQDDKATYTSIAENIQRTSFVVGPVNHKNDSANNSATKETSGVEDVSRFKNLNDVTVKEALVPKSTNFNDDTKKSDLPKEEQPLIADINNSTSSFDLSEDEPDESFFQDVQYEQIDQIGIQILDKINGEVKIFNARVSETLAFKRMRVNVVKCFKTKSLDGTEYVGFVEILEIKDDNTVEKIYSGWMFSEHSINVLEHAIYDVRIVESVGE